MSATAGLPAYATPTSRHAMTTSRFVAGFANLRPVRLGPTLVASRACCSRLSVICWGTFYSPLSLVPVAKPDRRRVHEEEQNEEDDDRRGSKDLEVLLRPR